jgi:hypothetical protein
MARALFVTGSLAHGGATVQCLDAARYLDVRESNGRPL